MFTLHYFCHISGIYYFTGEEAFREPSRDVIRTDQGKPVMSAVYSYAHYQYGFVVPMNLVCTYRFISFYMLLFYFNTILSLNQTVMIILLKKSSHDHSFGIIWSLGLMKFWLFAVSKKIPNNTILVFFFFFFIWDPSLLKASLHVKLKDIWCKG